MPANLFGTAAARWLWLALIAFAVFAYEAVTVSYQRSPRPPAEFVNIVTSTVVDREQIAEEYWQSAAVLEATYPHLTELPALAPASFQSPTALARLSATQRDLLTQQLWKQLRVLWLKPTTWQRTFTFDGNWVTNMVRSLSNLLEKYVPFVRGS
ncbi:MAG: hypothetical protein KGK08_06885 [Acidobacteriota bacterium]|nr:hypothetical protein [Acidobacteriota bacterium]